MKVAISRGDLVKTLGSVHSVVERRNTIPVLSNVLLAAGQGQLRFTATDLDIEINARADADVIRPGEITTPAATLYEIARKLHDSAIVTLELDGSEQRLNVSAEKSRFLCPCCRNLISDDGAGEFSARFMIGARDLARLIEKTEFAISSEETRFYLNGIFLHVVQNGAGKVLRGVATDGHRLALPSFPPPTPPTTCRASSSRAKQSTRSRP
jgi:DNA polymerase III, beta subunit (EC 2.7.7.7)